MIGITGAKGVLGRIISQKLESQIIDFSIFNGDIRNENAVLEWLKSDKITYVIHLASKVAVSDVENNISEAYEVNVSGTINLIKAIGKLNHPIGVFYASTSHVYESSSLPLKETDLINPINSYGLTKRISELLLLDYSTKNKTLNLCIGRIFSFYHESQNPPFLYPNLLNRFRTEDLSKPFKLYGANSTRDFLNAEVVCDHIISLVKLNYKGIVNIASGKSTKIIDFVKSISPEELTFDFNQLEMVNHLNADISLLNKILNTNE
jgi:nucleoside-diphosphate-sugar epimerase